jgi:hypothetical protein
MERLPYFKKNRADAKMLEIMIVVWRAGYM